MQTKVTVLLAILALAGGGCATTGVHTGVAHVNTELARRGAPVAAAPSVNRADGIDENEGVALALAHNAQFLELLADLGFTFADLEQARLIPNPVLTLLLPFPIGNKTAEGTIRQLTDTIRFRSQRIKIAEVASRRVAERLVQNGLDLIRDVRVAFADLTAARRRVALVEQTHTNQQKLADLMQARLKSGDVSKLEVALIETEMVRLAEDLPRQRSVVDQATARLKQLVGLVQNDAGVTFTDAVPRAGLPPPVGPLVRRALDSRPEARATVLAVQEAGRRAKLTEHEIITLTGVLDANFNPGDFELGPGVDVSLPVFNRNEANRARASAEVERARRAYVTVRDRIAREVREAEARARRAAEVLVAQRSKTLPLTADAEQRARKAHELGEASLVVVLDARRQWLDARARELDSDAELRRAWAELERSVGERVTGASVDGGAE